MGSNKLQPTTPAREAIEHLFQEYAGRLFGMGLKMCGDPHEAEDLVQETFIRAYRSWSGFRGESSPSTWLYTIAARVCQRMHRRRSGQPERVESLTRLLPSGDEAFDVPSDQASPLDETVRREAAQLVRSAAASLDVKYRLPLALKDLLDLSIDEVGEVLALKPSTVRSRVHRARLQLAREVRRRLATGVDGNAGRSDAICLDLLHIKQTALDAGKESPVSEEELCDRCGTLFDSLDITPDARQSLVEGEISDRLQTILDGITVTSPDTV